MSSDALGRHSQLDQNEFDSFRQFLQKVCGISLGENKQYLVNTRIKRILVENNLDSLATLVQQIKQSRHSRLREKVIDAMTTNETFWFRDTYPFEQLKNSLLSELQQRGAAAGKSRIWCAACSSGQEPYSISMTVEEHRRLYRSIYTRPIEIVATDLSSVVLEQAHRGEYDKLSVVRGLSSARLETFFDKTSEHLWRIKPEIRQRVEFRTINLMDSYKALGKFDIIFCRNVLIYFSAELKQDILQRLHAALKPQGILFLGSSEGLSGISDLFEMVHCNPGILYRAV